MNVTTDIDAKDVIRAFAAMKGIEVSKVVKNASKDFSKAAWKATPRARVKKSDYARLLWGGEFHFIKISNFERLRPKRRYRKKKGKPYRGYSYQLKRLHKARVRIPVMWSQASWIGVFRALGMNGRMPPIGQNKPKVAEIGRVSNPFYTKTHAEVVITDDIRFTSDEWRGTPGQIARKGFEAAARNISREYKRMMREIAQGRKP